MLSRIFGFALMADGKKEKLSYIIGVILLVLNLIGLQFPRW